jgi:DNA repair protein RecO (recombination protein O)
MSQHSSEAVLLRTWPFHESDLMISLFTREAGKLRGVAKAALKSRKRFGGALEPMTCLRANYTQLPRQDLVRFESFEPVVSPLAQPVDYLRAAALALYAEVLEAVLPEHDPHDAIFRLTPAVLAETQVGRCWMPITYFSLWITRLSGWLPDIDRCTVCAERLSAGGFFHAAWDGLTCSIHRREGSGTLDPDSIALALRMLHEPVSAIGEPWPRDRARDLRRFLWRTLERHVEHHLRAADALLQLGG